MKYRSGSRLPRLNSPEGISARQELRVANMPKSATRGEYTVPGSRNVKKVGRG